jgi:hypothetical protein
MGLRVWQLLTTLALSDFLFMTTAKKIRLTAYAACAG